MTAFNGVPLPGDGEAIRFENGKMVVPDNPILPFIEGDGTGRDIWKASQRVFDGVQALGEQGGVASVGEPQFNDSKSVAIVFVTPNSAPQDEATADLVDRLRGEVVPAATEGSSAAVYVSGLNAAFIDIADRIMERLPLFLLYVIGVTFIVLAMAFRSVVIALTAAPPGGSLRPARSARASRGSAPRGESARARSCRP